MTAITSKCVLRHTIGGGTDIALLTPPRRFLYQRDFKPHLRRAIKRHPAQRLDAWSLHVLGTEADPNQPRGSSPQHRLVAQQLQGPWKSKRLGAGKNSANHVISYNDLKPLSGSRRERPAALYRVEFAFRRCF